MLNEFYERTSSTKIRRWQLVEETDKTTIEGDIVELNELLALSSGTKEQLISKAPDLLGSNPDPTITNVDNFDTTHRKRKEKLQDILDYWNYDTLPASGIDDIQTTWISLSSLAQGSGAVIQNVCGENVGQEASLAIDGLNSTHWIHSVDEKHSITIDLTYPKTINGIRIWIPTSAAVYQLSNVIVEGAKTVGGLSKSTNILASGISFTGDSTWSAHIFSGGKTRVRYLRLRNIDTDNVSNTLRMREIEVHALTKFFDLEGN